MLIERIEEIPLGHGGLKVRAEGDAAAIGDLRKLVQRQAAEVSELTDEIQRDRNAARAAMEWVDAAMGRVDASMGQAEERELIRVAYGHVARVAWNGDISVGGGVSTGTGYSNWYMKAGEALVKVQAEAGRYTIWVGCDDAGDLEYFRQLANETPAFPFPIAAAALCAGMLGDPQAKDDLAGARDLLEKTTLVSGHHPSHGWFLASIRRTQERLSRETP